MSQTNTKPEQNSFDLNAAAVQAPIAADACERDVEVLYQKMGDRWFAFSLIDDEVFVGSISQREIDDTDGDAAGDEVDPPGTTRSQRAGNS